MYTSHNNAETNSLKSAFAFGTKPGVRKCHVRVRVSKAASLGTSPFVTRENRPITEKAVCGGGCSRERAGKSPSRLLPNTAIGSRPGRFSERCARASGAEPRRRKPTRRGKGTRARFFTHNARDTRDYPRRLDDASSVSSLASASNALSVPGALISETPSGADDEFATSSRSAAAGIAPAACPRSPRRTSA